MAEVSKKKQRQIRSSLGGYVRRRFEEARSAKSEVFATLQTCLKQVRGESIVTGSIDPEVDVNFNITSPIVRGVVGLIRDVFANSMESPFVIKATPIADLTRDIERTVLDVLMRKYEEVQSMNGMLDERAIIADVQESLRGAGSAEKQKRADLAAERMNKLIQDRLYDADWLKEFGDFIYNFVAYPNAVMKAPAMKHKRWKEWDEATGRMTVKSKVVRAVENISPFDFYPAPFAQDIQSAEYVIERRKISRSELVECYALTGYSEDGLNEVFEKHPNGFVEPYEDGGDPPEADIEGASEDGDHTDAQGAFDCLGFYGSIQGNVLASFGVAIEDERRNYDAEVWIIDDIVIKAVLNPDPLGTRPFYTASFEPIPGAFWGECITTRLKDTQRVVTSTMIAHVVNLAFASGVLGEVDSDRIVDNEDPRVVMPNTLREVVYEPKHNNSPAIRFYSVPDLSGPLTNVMQFHQQQAYELTGLPRVAFGSSENLGTVGRTSGGVAMVLNQASKSVKYGLRMLEERIIEPVIQSFIDYELFYNSDESIKGDIRVHARGVSGLVEKENKENKLEWALQSLAPFAGRTDPVTGEYTVPESAIRAILYELLKSAGINTEQIFPNYEIKHGLESDFPAVPQAPVGGATLDGRSANAMDAISASNGMVNGNPQIGGM